MKSIIQLSFLLLATICMFCTSQSRESSESTDMEKWNELDSFHSIMAAVYHPLNDSGNVQPALQQIGALANEAEKWAAAPLPKKVDNDEVRNKIEQLKNDTRALDSAIKAGATETEVAKALTEIHDLFHGIMEAWEGGTHEEHHDMH